MPKIGAALPLPGDEAVKTDLRYLIVDAVVFRSDVQGFEGVRVTLDGGKGNLLALPLWLRETVSKASKLGCFITELGDDTDTWVGKIIKFVSWTARKREIEVVEE